MEGALAFDKNSFVVVSNRLIDARYRLRMSEIRLLILMIFAFEQTRREVRMSVQDVAEIIGLKGDSRSALQRVTRNLMKQNITIEEANGSQGAHDILSNTSFIGGTVTIRLSPYMEQHLANLKNRFSKYGLAYGLALKSAYGFRLYQFGKKGLGLKKTGRRMDLDEFRKMLGIKEKSEYTQIRHFEESVLAVAQRDVNAMTDINVSYRLLEPGIGEKAIRLEFTFSEKEKKPYILCSRLRRGHASRAH